MDSDKYAGYWFQLQGWRINFATHEISECPPAFKGATLRGHMLHAANERGHYVDNILKAELTLDMDGQEVTLTVPGIKQEPPHA